MKLTRGGILTYGRRRRRRRRSGRRRCACCGRSSRARRRPAKSSNSSDVASRRKWRASGAPPLAYNLLHTHTHTAAFLTFRACLVVVAVARSNMIPSSSVEELEDAFNTAKNALETELSFKEEQLQVSPLLLRLFHHPGLTACVVCVCVLCRVCVCVCHRHS
jgi:hypothetical protein